MSSSSWQNAALVVLLVIAGGVSWAFQLREPLAVDTSPLRSLPAEVLSWESRDVPMEGTVEAILRADEHVQRSYWDDGIGGLVWMYVGYYGTARGGRSEHTPWVCYPTAGWEVLEEHSARLAVGGAEIQEMVVQRGDERRLVHFWYRTSRSDHVVGEIAHAWARFLGRLTIGRADGAFVRISTPLVGEGPESGRARLMSFRSELDGQLAAHWPVETGERSDG